MTKIALNMISKGKGEEDRLKQALSSIAPHVDKIFITLTSPRNLLQEAEKICREFNAEVSYNEAKWTADEKTVKWLEKFFGYEPEMKVGDKLFMFDEARNFALSQIPKEYEWFIWLDTDDIFVGGEHLRRLAEAGDQQNIEAFYFNYLYQAEFDATGRLKHRIIEHLRERLVRNNGHFKWIAPIHETLIEQVPTKKTDVPDCEVVHLATHDDRVKSLTRNLKSLELAIARSEGKDPRHVYYLAKAYFDINTPETDAKAIPLIHRYLQGDEKGDHKSGWPEERQQGWEYLSELYRRQGKHNNAMKAVLNSFTEPCEPQPELFLSLALSCIHKQLYELALFWVKMASHVQQKKTTLVTNQRDLQARTLEIIYNACLNTAKVDEAHAAATKILELFPDAENTKDAYKLINEIKTQRDMTKKVVELAKYLDATGEGHKVRALLEAAPSITEETPFIQEISQKVNPPRSWDTDEIMIYCGPGFTDWSPKSLSDPKGSFVGGSEEAVIRMTQELQKLGWKVTVYGSPGVDQGNHNGVMWLPYFKFNKKDEFNIVISWRQLGFFDLNLKAKKTYLWNHDLQNAMEYTPERVDKITKVMFLSKFHRDNVPSLPDEKVFLTSNGI